MDENKQKANRGGKSQGLVGLGAFDPEKYSYVKSDPKQKQRSVRNGVAEHEEVA